MRCLTARSFVLAHWLKGAEIQIRCRRLLWRTDKPLAEDAQTIDGGPERGVWRLVFLSIRCNLVFRAGRCRGCRWRSVSRWLMQLHLDSSASRWDCNGPMMSTSVLVS